MITELVHAMPSSVTASQDSARRPDRKTRKRESEDHRALAGQRPRNRAAVRRTVCQQTDDSRLVHGTVVGTLEAPATPTGRHRRRRRARLTSPRKSAAARFVPAAARFSRFRPGRRIAKAAAANAGPQKLAMYAASAPLSGRHTPDSREAPRRTHRRAAVGVRWADDTIEELGNDWRNGPDGDSYDEM